MAVELDSGPYELPKDQWSMDIEMWPGIGCPDIYMYLVSTPGKYTKRILKACKSRNAWPYFKAGLGGEIKVMMMPIDVVVVCGQVCAKPETWHEMTGTTTLSNFSNSWWDY